MLYKKGSPRNLDNYRQITVQSTFRTLFCRILEQRLRRVIPLNEVQNGFRKGRSTSDNPFLLDQLIQECNRPGSKDRAYLAFIDFRKAFDSVGVSMLMQRLEEKGVDANMLQVLMSLYRRPESAI